MKEQITRYDYLLLIADLARQVRESKKQYGSIFPIPRGGYLPAIELGKLLGLPVNTDGVVRDDSLIVDDICDSGATLSNYTNDKAVVFCKSRARDKVQFYAAVDDNWLLIPDEKETGIEDHLRRIIEYIGENPNREGLVGTPDRIVRMWREIFRGYDPSQKPRITTFANDEHTEQMIFDSGDYYSMCEHHMLPFFGKYYFAYIPAKDGRILGISKIARVVGYCGAKLQLQERLAEQVLDMLADALDGQYQGMAIVMRGQHMCKSMRGAKNQGEMSVAVLRGIFKENADLRMEFYKMIDLQR